MPLSFDLTSISKIVEEAVFLQSEQFLVPTLSFDRSSVCITTILERMYLFTRCCNPAMSSCASEGTAQDLNARSRRKAPRQMTLKLNVGAEETDLTWKFLEKLL